MYKASVTSPDGKITDLPILAEKVLDGKI